MFLFIFWYTNVRIQMIVAQMSVSWKLFDIIIWFQKSILRIMMLALSSQRNLWGGLEKAFQQAPRYLQDWPLSRGAGCVIQLFCCTQIDAHCLTWWNRCFLEGFSGRISCKFSSYLWKIQSPAALFEYNIEQLKSWRRRGDSKYKEPKYRILWILSFHLLKSETENGGLSSCNLGDGNLFAAGNKIL